MKRHKISVHFKKKGNLSTLWFAVHEKRQFEGSHIASSWYWERESSFQCDDCQETFEKKSNFERHSGYLKTECSICSALFCTLKQLQQHKLNSHPKHECPKCERKFQDKAHLERHSKADAPIRICEVCNKEFCTSGDLKKHMKSHVQGVFVLSERLFNQV